MKVAAVVLTFNEEVHIERCLKSLDGVVSTILVVDSFSKDKTVELAIKNGAVVLQNNWVNHATQFNWSLKHLEKDIDWILRLDADEYLTHELRQQIKEKLPLVEDSVAGISVNRQIVFLDKLIRYGGVLPAEVVRLMRPERGRCETRLMDEHIVVKGRVEHFSGDLIDNNYKPVTWWTAKHNCYSSREAVEMLNLKYQFFQVEVNSQDTLHSQTAYKRWIKEKVYARFPAGIRAFLYYFYRYVIRLGFLDGREGAMFHFLQGFWYRYLVDVKVLEVEKYMKKKKVSITQAIEKILEITI